MGFAEFGESLGRSNRALRDNTLGKYFSPRVRKRIAGFEEHQLPENLLKRAEAWRRRSMRLTYVLFIAITLAVIVVLLILY
jgi:hypothetical protein